MKKILSFVLILTAVFIFGVNTQKVAASAVENWTEQDAKVSSEVYNLLLERAGFAAYIYAGENISMNPVNLSNFVIEEKNEDFFIGKFNDNSNKIIVTKDGLIVSYIPKEVAYTIFRDDLHFRNVRDAVKIFIGPTIDNVNYINFTSLESNKAFIYYDSYSLNRAATIPTDAKINVIAYSAIAGHTYNKDYYGLIVPGSLQAGTTHKLQSYGLLIDDIKVYTKRANAMNVFYTSKTDIDLQGSSNYAKYNLTNNFVIKNGNITPPVENEIKDIRINKETNSMAPGDSQILSLIATNSDGSETSIPASSVKWTTTNPAVGQILNGKVTALKTGETTILANYMGVNTYIVIQVDNFKLLARKVNIPVDKVWTIKLNTAVDPKTVTKETVFVVGQSGEIIDVSRVVASNGESIQLIPIKNYSAGKNYTVWVKDLKSKTGKPLKQYTKMDFVTK